MGPLCSQCCLCCRCLTPILKSHHVPHDTILDGPAPYDFCNLARSTAAAAAGLIMQVFTAMLLIFQHRSTGTYRYTEGDFAAVWKLESFWKKHTKSWLLVLMRLRWGANQLFQRVYWCLKRAIFVHCECPSLNRGTMQSWGLYPCSSTVTHILCQLTSIGHMIGCCKDSRWSHPKPVVPVVMTHIFFTPWLMWWCT